jgi:signal transduction histidine kinase
MGGFRNILLIGNSAMDEEAITVKKQFLIRQCIGTCIGALIWGILFLWFSLPQPALISFGYILLTTVNLIVFERSKNLAIAGNIQAFGSILLPFSLQWLMGGFVASGCAMLWTIPAMVTTISYQNVRKGALWLFVYLVLTGISFWFDNYFSVRYSTGISANHSKILLICNVIAVSLLFFAAFSYFVADNDVNLERIKRTYNKLIDSEKLAALGQISAGVAHEVNTPLGAIKSSAEESALAFEQMLQDFAWLNQTLSHEERQLFEEFINVSQSGYVSLSTKEEREIKKIMRNGFEELHIENTRFLSDRLVQVGVYEVTPALEKLARLKQFERLMMLTYNLLSLKRSNQTIQLAVDKASRQVKALKTYVHNAHTEQKQPINLRDNIETVLTIYQNRLRQGIQVIKNYDEVPDVSGHPEELNQVWTNLIVNAVQAMGSKGILVIGIKKEPKEITVSIKDNGKGIPEEIQKKIFTPFFTTKASGEGSGLGLDIIQRILRNHAATIAFDSTEGEGTTFYVRFPIDKAS